jgi:hypothetical protein
MYAVVGCSDCRALWIVDGRPESSQCPRCGTTRPYAKRRKFLTTEDADHAREARAALLADRQGQADAFADVDAFGDLETAVERAGVDDETYLTESGLDAEAVAAAGARAESGPGNGQSNRDTVMAALRDLDDPDESAVVAYATDRGVSRDYVERTLDKLIREGAITRSDGAYRVL